MSTTGAPSLVAKRKQSILDTATADLTSLKTSLPGSENRKIEAYTESLRALETSL